MNARRSSWLAAISLVAVYVLAARLGVGLTGDTAGMSPVWPATGIAVAAVLMAGNKVWLGVFVGAFVGVVTLPSGAASWRLMAVNALPVATTEALQVLGASWLMRRFANGARAFESPLTVLHFSWIAPVSTLLNPTIAMAWFRLLSPAATPAHWGGWVQWWVGDAVSVIVLVPMLVTWWSHPDPGLTTRRMGELGLLLAGIIFGWELVSMGSPTQATGAPRLEFLLVPFLVLAALRFGQHGAASATFVLACVAFTAALRRNGLLTGDDGALSFLTLQVFLGLMGVMACTLAADTVQRQRVQQSRSAIEKRYRELFETNPQPILVYDLRQFRFLAANQAAVDLYGYQKGEFSQMCLQDIESSASTTLASEPSNHDSARQPRWHKKKDGTKFRVQIQEQELHPTLQPGEAKRDDAVPRSVGMFVKVEERSPAEEEVTRLNAELERRVWERTRQLEAINKELEAFSYSVSHDLRAPLRSIRGFNDVLLERYAEKLDERGQDFLRRACASTAQMDKLIEDLLKLSRAGRSQLKPSRVDLSTMAETIATELRKSQPQPDVEFTAMPGLHASGDERLLRVALENLLRNAWKFTSKLDHPRIEFGVVQEPEAAFYVRDNGAGFDMAHAQKLFGVFQRLHATSEFPGTGVGLATVQRIVRRHGGRAWAQAAVGQGATFYFTLPNPLEDIWASP